MRKRYAYQVWICATCGGHTLDLDSGGHRCESCGYDYDHRGTFEPDPEYDADYIAAHDRAEEN